MRTIGVIPARFESSRFPGKPLADILGRPMIWWVYQQCLKVEELDRVGGYRFGLCLWVLERLENRSVRFDFIS